MRDNKERIVEPEKIGTLPYFITDNKQFIPQTILQSQNENTSSGKISSGHKYSDGRQLSYNDTGIKLGEILSTDNLLKKAKELKLQYNKVQRLTKVLSDDEIIQKLGEYDYTHRSCVSQCLAYVGNKYGYNVKDMRGDISVEFFGDDAVWKMLCEQHGGLYFEQLDEIKGRNKVLSKIKNGETYILGIGDHSAIVRKNGEILEYLELQKRENGFRQLDKNAFRTRFRCGDKKHRDAYIINIDNLSTDDNFEEILGYFNTQQLRGKRKGRN